MIMTVLQGIIFEHHENMSSNIQQIKETLGQINMDYSNIDKFKETWLQYLLFEFYSHLIGEQSRFDQNEIV